MSKSTAPQRISVQMRSGQALTTKFDAAARVFGRIALALEPSPGLLWAAEEAARKGRAFRFALQAMQFRMPTPTRPFGPTTDFEMSNTTHKSGRSS